MYSSMSIPQKQPCSNIIEYGDIIGKETHVIPERNSMRTNNCIQLYSFTSLNETCYEIIGTFKEILPFVQ